MNRIFLFKTWLYAMVWLSVQNGLMGKGQHVAQK